MKNDFRTNINNLSPTEMANELLKYEFYDQETAKSIIANIYDEFDSKDNILEGFITPAFFHTFDEIITPLGLDKYGITPSRLVDECKGFDYDNEEYLVHKEGKKDIGELKTDRPEYSEELRKNKLDDGTKNNYKKEKFGDKKTIKSEYSDRIIYKDTNEAKKRNFKEQSYHIAETDHIEPIKYKYNELKDNAGLNDDDIVKIINNEENFAMVSQNTNRSKRDNSNGDFLNSDKEALNNLSQKDKQKIYNKGEEARRINNKIQNKKVAKNLISDKKVQNRLFNKSKSEAKKVLKENGVKRGIGEAIILFAKASFYEIKEIFKHSFEYKIKADSILEAIKIRFNRVKNYVIKNVKKVLSTASLEFVKALFTSIVGMIVNMFAGLIKKAWLIVKEGFSSIVEALKLIVSPPEDMSKAEIADSIVKILSMAALSIGGIAIESVIDNYVPEPFSNMISALLTGIAIAGLTYLLDKSDIFGVEHELRLARTEEIFNARINDIKENTKKANEDFLKVLSEQRNKFDNLREKLISNFEKREYDELASNMYDMADFMDIQLEYSNTEEFKDYLADGGIEM